MTKYLSKWKGISIKGWCIINEKVEKAFTDLLAHVRNGCLSNIPPGKGTNSNENLHKQLTGFLRNRLSVQSAESLFSHILYVHNCKKSNVNEKKAAVIVPSIWHKQRKIIDSRSNFGNSSNLETYQCSESREQLYQCLLESELGWSEHDYSDSSESIGNVNKLISGRCELYRRTLIEVRGKDPACKVCLMTRLHHIKIFFLGQPVIEQRQCIN